MSKSFSKERFGTGSFVGDAMRDPDFFAQTVQDQAEQIGWADGCPVALELTDPGNAKAGRGPEAMRSRYAEVNLWFGYIARQVQEVNPDLYADLMSTVPRRDGEPVGKFEPESVPEDYVDSMYPMNTITGYVLPRIFLEFISSNPEEDRQDRLVEGLDMLDRSIIASDTPINLLVNFADCICSDAHAPKQAIIKHMLGRGWLEEHNAVSVVSELKSVLSSSDGSAWQYYESLSEEDKDSLRIL